MAATTALGSSPRHALAVRVSNANLEPANIGYMSGALKYFFDQVYYPCLNARPRAPYGLYVHGASDTGGAVRAVTAIAGGMGWAEVVRPVIATGPVGREAERQCYELAATVAANLLADG